MAAEQPPKSALLCNECDGRGWHVGECHPREECTVCAGTGDLLSDAALAQLVEDFATCKPKYEQNAVEKREMARALLDARKRIGVLETALREFSNTVCSLRWLGQDQGRLAEADAELRREGASADGDELMGAHEALYPNGCGHDACALAEKLYTDACEERERLADLADKASL